MTAVQGVPRVALDTGILAGAEGIHGDRKKAAAGELIQKLPRESTVLPIQALGELCHVLIRLAGRSPASARAAVVSWHDAFPVVGTSPEVMLAATELITVREVDVWEAVILATAVHANCELLLSENYHEGFTWNGVTVANPFAEPRHPLLQMLLLPPDR